MCACKTADVLASATAAEARDLVGGEAGRLLFPVDEGYWSGWSARLRDLRFTWYSAVDGHSTVAVVSYVLNQQARGRQVFYRFYSDEEIAADPSKANTGLYFFAAEGVDGSAPFAVCNAGGGFAYVGALHDSMPHALYLARHGYNAFALIYRPHDPYNDLAAALRWIFSHADELGVDVRGYSLWGGSAGARMSAELGARATEAGVPANAAAVIMQYTGYTAIHASDPATYACVGTRDYIADWRTMQRRLQTLSKRGVDTEFCAYDGLSHGFGLGVGTVAEGWIDNAIAFWDRNR